MAVEFEKLKFTRDWNNTSDFPTYEENEQKVRADMQALHDETKEFINETLIPELEDTLENMTVPGTGDMKTEMYDPTGKHTDVFRYAEEKDAETMEMHLETAKHVDAYSKEETLSAETREALGLGEGAVPNDAFAKIAATPDVVMDFETGKKYTVKVGVGGVGLFPVATLNGLGEYITGLSAVGKTIVSVSDSVLGVVGYRTANNTYYMDLEVYDRETNEVVYTGTVNASTSSEEPSTTGQGGSVRLRWFLPDEKSLCCYRGYVVMYDAVSGTTVGDASYIYAAICKDDFLVYYKSSGTGVNQSKIYVVNRSEKTSKTYSIGRSMSPNQTMHFIGFKGDDLYMIDGSNRLMSINCKTGAMTFDIKAFDTNLFPTIDSVYFSSVYPVLVTGKYAFFVVQGGKSVNSVNRAFFKTKLLRFDLSDMSDNSAELASVGYEMEGETIMQDIDPGYYMGSVGDKAYFLRNSRVTVLDTEANEFEYYTLVDDGTTTAQGHGSRQEVQFAIPELPGIILCGTLMLDTKKGTAQKIPATEKIDVSYGAAYRGTVTKTDIVGMQSLKLLAGGNLTYQAERFEEYTE